MNNLAVQLADIMKQIAGFCSRGLQATGYFLDPAVCLNLPVVQIMKFLLE